MASVYQIEQLETVNYDWSIQMRSVLVHEEAWSVIGDATPIEQPEIWDAQNVKALSTQLRKLKNCLTTESS